MLNQVCLKQETFDQLLSQALSNCSIGSRRNIENYQFTQDDRLSPAQNDILRNHFHVMGGTNLEKKRAELHEYNIYNAKRDIYDRELKAGKSHEASVRAAERVKFTCKLGNCTETV